jgi:hypothetical protein
VQIRKLADIEQAMALVYAGMPGADSVAFSAEDYDPTPTEVGVRKIAVFDRLSAYVTNKALGPFEETDDEGLPFTRVKVARVPIGWPIQVNNTAEVQTRSGTLIAANRGLRQLIGELSVSRMYPQLNGLKWESPVGRVILGKLRQGDPFGLSVQGHFYAVGPDGAPNTQKLIREETNDIMASRLIKGVSYIFKEEQDMPSRVSRSMSSRSDSPPVPQAGSDTFDEWVSAGLINELLDRV